MPIWWWGPTTTPSVSTPSVIPSIRVQDLCTDAMLELGLVAAGNVPSGDDLAWVLSKLNRIIDRWNIDRNTIYADVPVSYTTTPALQPHTIGPTGTFVVTQRPVAIDGATLILTGARYPLDGHDVDWWRNLSLQTITSSMPTDFYYSADWPNGSLYLWPVPTAAVTLELQTRIVLTQFLLPDTLSLPPGYQDAVTLTLAESIAPGFKVAVDPAMAQAARFARAQTFGANSAAVKLTTKDEGMPGSSSGGFNYRTRSFS